MRIRDLCPPALKAVYWKGRECVEPKYKVVRYFVARLVFQLQNSDRNFGLDRRHVPIASINPYDALHRDVDDEHRKGIDALKAKIEEGKSICPILVCSFENDKFPEHCGKLFEQRQGVTDDFEYQRLDGFKRYMASKELGHENIEVIVDDDSFPGGQHKMSWLEKSKSRTNLEYQFIKSIGREIFVWR